MDLYTVSPKNVPSLVCYNFDIAHFDIFGRNVTDKISNQKALYYATSNKLQGKTGKHKNRIFSLNAVLVHCQNSTSHSLVSSVFLTHNSYTRAAV